MLGGLGCQVCLWSRPIFAGGGVGAAKGLLPFFVVPKGNQPMACTLALWWLKLGPTEVWGGEGASYRGRGGGGGWSDPYIYGVKWPPHCADHFEVEM